LEVSIGTTKWNRIGGWIGIFVCWLACILCQQRIAMENKVAFLNFFQMMGGRNSIAELVNRRMVGHDYTHPSYGGGRLLATKMMASLMAGYE
jgi:hypothetical protein